MEGFGNRIEYFERMLAGNPDNPTGLLALANEYRNADRPEDEAATLDRYLSAHPCGRSRLPRLRARPEPHPRSWSCPAGAHRTAGSGPAAVPSRPDEVARSARSP